MRTLALTIVAAVLLGCLSGCMVYTYPSYDDAYYYHAYPYGYGYRHYPYYSYPRYYEPYYHR